MASLELSPLSAHLEKDEIAAIRAAAEEAGIKDLDIDEDADPVLLDKELDDDLFADFFDRLDANDAACDIYLPAEFEETFEVVGYRVGSANALALVLEELKEDFFLDEAEEEEGEAEGEADYGDYEDELDDDDDEDYGGSSGEADVEIKDQQFRHFWKVMQKGARTALARGVCLFVHQ